MPAMNLYQSSMRRLSRTAWFRKLLSRVLTPLDMRLRNTRFAPSNFGVDFPLCYLTSSGRRSGKPRTVPLLYVRTDDGPAVVATNFGTEHHPGWSYNLDADPAAVLEIDEKSVDVMAHRLSRADSESLWPAFDQVWPGYEVYRTIAPRDIKMYVLKPA